MSGRADDALAYVAARSARGAPLPDGSWVGLHFHPDGAPGGETLKRIVSDGVYVSQFATGTSNGGLTAVPGGDRWQWEHRLFGSVYDDAPAEERPVYGALGGADANRGPAPRFGSAYLRLRPEATARATFAFPDSAHGERHQAFGVARSFALDERLRRTRLVDPLDHYVEAHVHGGVVLRSDVAAIVLDPSYRNTAIEALARATGVPVEWHGGYRIDAGSLTDGLAVYRGAEVLTIARAIAAGRPLTPALLGRARTVRTDDPQKLKRVWHLLARFG